MHWPLTDHLGNILSETDDTIDHIFGFKGRERDEESDLHARFYDPIVGLARSLLVGPVSLTSP